MYRAKYLSPTNDVSSNKVFSHPTILKHFLNTIFRLPEEEKIVSLEYLSPRTSFKNLSYVLVNLDLFKKEKEEELESLEDQWLYYMKYVEKFQKCPKNLTEEEIKRAYDIIAQANWDQGEFDEYIK